MPPDVLAEVGADRRHLPVDAGLHLAGEEGIAVAFRRAAPLPRHAVTDEAHRAPCLVARGIETHLPQQHQDVHGGVPPAVPRRAAPPPVGPLEGEQPRTRALGGDPRALGRDLVRGRIGQVPHHLPADRRVRIEQPVDDGHGSPSDRGVQWFGAPAPPCRPPRSQIGSARTPIKCSAASIARPSARGVTRFGAQLPRPPLASHSSIAFWAAACNVVSSSSATASPFRMRSKAAFCSARTWASWGSSSLSPPAWAMASRKTWTLMPGKRPASPSLKAGRLSIRAGIAP